MLIVFKRNVRVDKGFERGILKENGISKSSTAVVFI